jgi:hypothetical protein
MRIPADLRPLRGAKEPCGRGARMSVVFRFPEVCKSYRSQLPSTLGPHAPDTGNPPSGIMKDG